MKKLAEKNKMQRKFWDKLILKHISSPVSGQVDTKNIFSENYIDKGEEKGERKMSSETRVMKIKELSITGFREDPGSRN